MKPTNWQPAHARHDADGVIPDDGAPSPHWQADCAGYERDDPPISVYADELESIPY